MPFFVDKNKGYIDSVTDSEVYRRVAPDVYEPRLQAIKEMRQEGSRTPPSNDLGFAHVASFVNVPLFNAISTVLDPDFMRNKKNFYAWLDRNLEYCAYDRRRKVPGRAPKGVFAPGPLWKEESEDGGDEGWSDGESGELSASSDS